MGKADGIEVEKVDGAAWEAAMLSFRQTHPAAIRRQPSPMSSLSLHALRLISPGDRVNDPIK